MSGRRARRSADSVEISRRSLLRQTAVGAVSLPGLTLWSSLFGVSPVFARAAKDGTAKSIIFVSLYGGPPHQDTYDLKEDAPTEIRGEFQSIATSLNAFRVCEYLPKLRLRTLFTPLSGP